MEVMRVHTLRQLRAWLAWLRMEFENPDRGDYYLMQLTQQVIAGNLKGSKKTAPSIHKLILQRKKSGPKLTVEEATTRAKEVWGMRIPKSSIIPEEQREEFRKLRPPRIDGPVPKRQKPLLQDPLDE